MKSILLSLMLICFSSNTVLASHQCSSFFNSSAQENLIKKNFLEKSTALFKPLGKSAKGYAIILTSMIFTAALSHFLTANLSTDYKFLSYFVSQLSVLGIVVLGAPLWEPLSSHIRSIAFNVHDKKGEVTTDGINKELETLWTRTQTHYPLNAQMSRNVILSAIQNIQVSLYEAQKAVRDNNSPYAVKQIAMIAIRLRTLFAEIDPKDNNVSSAFKNIFPNAKPELAKEILLEIQTQDPSSKNEDVKKYYDQLLASWF